ncbi:Crp/Fnr family transcriptional regulator [Clostridium grantii]|uniref:cAMP-binding domain of CRP or a regulatory subunit of cAMP-dependent protein kinases n=1 Tax=Clostridium grantii DSM 8605 TaxID=1121316 RepID=A0A1M5TMU4_9CLOT|nr:Crp/Fnr family transcriptional regulator [Clostridium grantii]SHH52008.1 cAMP-binding domain of CRP or a regulatory subunit of cAMP-dependent protein kinases [Clostridium grantii DSM 8605]
MDIKNYLHIITLTDLFKSFSTSQLYELFKTNQYTLSQYKKDNIIYFESELCTSLDIILKGELIIQKIDEKGNVLTIAEFRVGDNIGGNLLFSKPHCYPMSVLSKSATEILHINKDFVLNLCQIDQNFLIEFLTCISDKTSILTNKIKSISMKSIKESIIEFLNYEYYSQKNEKIQLHMTKKELAEKLGIQRTSLSRELNKMKKDGLVDYDASSITICDFSIIRNF